MSAFSYLILNSLDAAGNLAAEQVIFDTLPRGESCFLLWQNRSAVVIGRHQDALAEIDRTFVEENGIQLVRRISGGGAVYHDLGNLNYSVITEAQGSKAPDMAVFCEQGSQVLGCKLIDDQISPFCFGFESGKIGISTKVFSD